MSLAWSPTRMNEMLNAARLCGGHTKFLKSLNSDQWDDFGDWLWYELHPEEQRSKRFIDPPAFAHAFLEEHRYKPRLAKRKDKE